MRMYRVLLLFAALPLVGPAGVGSAARTDSNIEIVAIDLAGRQTNLTHDPAFDASPAVARDGRIVFVSTRGGNGADLYVMDRDGRNVRRLTRSATDHSGVTWGDALDLSQASWSPGGEQIAFDGLYNAEGPGCEQHCAGWDALVIGSDGSGLRQIALRARAPAWSPDGSRLAYESDVDPFELAGNVTITRLDGTGSVRVNGVNHFSDTGPAWSPSGKELAFQASRIDGSPISIYVTRADGRRTRRLALGQNPTWSPDGRRLAFIDGCKLMTIGESGKGKRRISRKGESVVGAVWSPKGATIAYVAGTAALCEGGLPRNLRLETVSPDGRRFHVLVRGAAASSILGEPVWTRDGKQMLVAL